MKIISPAAGQFFKEDQVPVRFKLAKGKHGHHVHAFVNGELMGMFEGEQGTTLNGVKPGRHILELRVLMAIMKPSWPLKTGSSFLSSSME